MKSILIALMIWGVLDEGDSTVRVLRWQRAPADH